MAFPGDTGNLRPELAPPQAAMFASSIRPERRTKRSRLHDFSFSSWGSQKLVRCAKLGGDGAAAAAAFLGKPVAREEEEDDDDLKRFKDRLMDHLQTAANRIDKVTRSERKKASVAAPREQVPVSNEEKEDAGAAVERPWNLRTRRSACNAPADNGQRRGQDRPLAEAVRNAADPKSLSNSDAHTEKRFSISLTREEIKEDLIKLFGAFPTKKPKKRPQKVQRLVDKICPGMWLSEITPDDYKLPEEK